MVHRCCLQKVRAQADRSKHFSAINTWISVYKNTTVNDNMISNFENKAINSFWKRSLCNQMRLQMNRDGSNEPS